MLIDHIAPIPPVVIGAFRVVPGLPEGIELFIQEVVVVHLNGLIHSAFFQVVSEDER